MPQERITIGVRLTQREYFKLRAAAKAASETISDYVRERIGCKKTGGGANGK